ncbi:Homeobox protein homothorax [Amphibalanus amphitrite]|uniref:Homeobox protein homothorax n=1 Tax=Amphibalanus amphitrite TaxID=1232801 RepID=A0A6A4VVY1_AMPAM|nr:Homeobox protein homothorax [Amphibalanus amphitrite]
MFVTSRHSEYFDCEGAKSVFKRPPSSSLSFSGQGAEDVRSPGSGGTPGPLSHPPASTQSADNGSEAAARGPDPILLIL